MAMSASLSTDDIEETLQVLQIPNCPIVRIPPDRPNLVYRVKMADDKKGDISKFIGEKYKEKTGIIYCTKTGDCEKVAKELQKKGVIAQAYYAALTDEEKSTLETNWMMGKLHVMVATIAFGMGIDKADVSFVIHFNMPTSLGDYYQESGRAGRNGKEAECVIYYNFTDSHMKYTLGRDSCRDSNKKLELRKLQEPTHKVMEMCLDPFRCRRWWILGHLNPTNAPQENCQACDVCLGEHDKNITHNLYNIAAMLVNLLIRVHAQYSYDDSEYHVHPDRLAEICMIPTSRSAEKSRSIAQQCGWDGSEASQSFPNGQKLTITRLARICAYLVLNEVFIEYPRDCGKYGPRWYLAVGPRVDEFLQHPSSEFPVPMPI
ncbi:P-loop containing nucleoside triphosphate hydrolase protein [Rickenella mellea]|uniref:DNA 3'-5' helicase n=1 Tax=Rickenella mellea TaxID=50990 RepID=A0A4Y7QL03_9AGAM|nr:P-loop containing nucleoside triphosphate hydrolase protein [Rickenella mellea]